MVGDRVVVVGGLREEMRFLNLSRLRLAKFLDTGLLVVGEGAALSLLTASSLWSSDSSSSSRPRCRLNLGRFRVNRLDLTELRLGAGCVGSLAFDSSSGSTLNIRNQNIFNSKSSFIPLTRKFHFLTFARHNRISHFLEN